MLLLVTHNQASHIGLHKNSKRDMKDPVRSFCAFHSCKAVNHVRISLCLAFKSLAEMEAEVAELASCSQCNTVGSQFSNVVSWEPLVFGIKILSRWTCPSVFYSWLFRIPAISNYVFPLRVRIAKFNCSRNSIVNSSSSSSVSSKGWHL